MNSYFDLNFKNRIVTMSLLACMHGCIAWRADAICLLACVLGVCVLEREQRRLGEVEDDWLLGELREKK